jgi:hypothetical protein
MASFTVNSDNGEKYRAVIANTGFATVMVCPNIDLLVVFYDDDTFYVKHRNTEATTQNKFECINNTDAIGAFIKIWRFVQARSAFDISDIFQKRTKSARASLLDA